MPGITVLTGPNGQVKTGLPEAAYLLATGRSFRTTRLEELARRKGGLLRGDGTVYARPGGRDTVLGFTADGPQRDDPVLELGGVDLRQYGSAGQVRAAMVALKLGKVGLLR